MNDLELIQLRRKLEDCQQIEGELNDEIVRLKKELANKTNELNSAIAREEISKKQGRQNQLTFMEIADSIRKVSDFNIGSIQNAVKGICGLLLGARTDLEEAKHLLENFLKVWEHPDTTPTTIAKEIDKLRIYVKGMK